MLAINVSVRNKAEGFEEGSKFLMPISVLHYTSDSAIEPSDTGDSAQ